MVGFFRISWVRPGMLPGRTLLSSGIFLLLLVFLGVGKAQARPADSILNFLQQGSRPDLGLGGDPFLSPLLRQSGWWDQDLLDDLSDVQLRNYQYLPVTRRLSGGDSEIEFAYTQLGGRYVVERWDRKLHLGLSITSARASAELNGDLASVGLGESGGSLAGIARLEQIVPGLSAQISFPLGESSSRRSGEGLRYGFHYALMERLFLTSAWSRWDSQESILAQLDDEVVDSPLNLKVDNIHHGARLNIWRSLAFEMSLRESDYLASNELSGGEYEFLPEAWSMSRQQSLEWGGESGLRVLLRHSDAQLNGSGGGYWAGQRYLRVSHTHADLESILGAIQISMGQRRRLIADMEFGDFDAFGRIGVDSWRFASWEQAWSGAKKVIQVDGKGRWERYHVGYESPWGAWDLGGGLSYYEIYPQGYSESWIHVPFLRPQDYEKIGLSTSRLSLGAISLRALRRFGRFEISGELHQFVYGNDHIKEDASPSVPPPTDPDPDSGPGGWFGGTYAMISFGYSF